MTNIDRRDFLTILTSLAAVPVDLSSTTDQKTGKKTIKDVLIENQIAYNKQQSITPQQNALSITAISHFVDNLVSQHLFGVQPLSLPKGNVYYLDLNSSEVRIYKSEITSCNKKHQNLESNSLPAEYFDLHAQVLGEALALEVDRQNVTNVLNNAGTTLIYDFAAAEGKTKREKFETLHVQIFEARQLIHKKTSFGSGNWIIASPEVCQIFEMADENSYCQFSPNDILPVSLGIDCVGTINKNIKLYKDPLFRSNEILIGYTGNPMSSMSNGYFYCPYLMFSDFSSKCVTTDACEILTPSGQNFYAKIQLINMPSSTNLNDQVRD